VNIDHLQHSTTKEGPISWITSGKVDAVLDIKFPRDPHDDLPFNAIFIDIADAISTSFSPSENHTLDRIPGQRELAKPPLSAPEEESESGDDKRKVVVDIDLRFRDLKAAVPIFTNDLSYVNNALIRPIVAFMRFVRSTMPSGGLTIMCVVQIGRWCPSIVGLSRNWVISMVLGLYVVHTFELSVY
jgi:distribution and morphology protein 31